MHNSKPKSQGWGLEWLRNVRYGTVWYGGLQMGTGYHWHRLPVASGRSIEGGMAVQTELNAHHRPHHYNKTQRAHDIQPSKQWALNSQGPFNSRPLLPGRPPCPGCLRRAWLDTRLKPNFDTAPPMVVGSPRAALELRNVATLEPYFFGCPLPQSVIYLFIRVNDR